MQLVFIQIFSLLNQFTTKNSHYKQKNMLKAKNYASFPSKPEIIKTHTLESRTVSQVNDPNDFVAQLLSFKFFSLAYMIT